MFDDLSGMEQMTKKNNKRDMATITLLIEQVETMRKADPKLSILAACKKVGLRKETYYSRLRAVGSTKAWPSTPVENSTTEALMKEFIALEKRMGIVKKELSLRIDN